MMALNPTMEGISFLFVLLVTSSKPCDVLTEFDIIIQNRNISYVCGRNMTLICKFKYNAPVIIWNNENDITPIAQCTYSVCRLNPVYVGQYDISFDMAQGIFNLTLINVTMKDNGRKLVCSDGSHTDSRIIRVRGYEPRLFEDRKIGTIKATSGCNSRDKQVSFEWIRISARSNVESTINGNISYKNISCSTDSECGHYNGIEYTSIIHAKPSNNGNFYLKLAVIYDNERIELRKSAIKYMIDGQDNNSDTNSDNRTKSAIIVTIVVAGICFLATISIVVRNIYRLNKRRPSVRTAQCVLSVTRGTESIFIPRGHILCKIGNVTETSRSNYLCPFTSIENIHYSNIRQQDIINIFSCIFFIMFFVNIS